MFLPKQKAFFDLYESLAKKIIKATKLLEKIADDYSSTPQVAEELNQLEDEADGVVHQIIENLHYDHTRITEEKGDIRILVHNMDNVVDAIEKAVNRLDIYRIKQLPPNLPKFIPFLIEAAEQIEVGVKSLRKIRKNDQVLKECCIKINDLENKADQVHRQCLSRLVRKDYSNQEEFKEILTAKEVIDALEYAMDQCEDVANILETFRLKGEA